MRDHFSAHGPLTDAVVMYDQHSGRSRGFGFVTFQHNHNIDDILATPQIVDGKEVEKKRRREEEEEEGGGEWRLFILLVHSV